MVHWSVNCSVLRIIGSIESLTALVIMGSLCLPESGYERFLIVVAGVLSFFGQLFLTLAALYENAATIGLLKKAFDVALAFVFQIAYFKVISKIFQPFQNHADMKFLNFRMFQN